METEKDRPISAFLLDFSIEAERVEREETIKAKAFLASHCPQAFGVIVKCVSLKKRRKKKGVRRISRGGCSLRAWLSSYGGVDLRCKNTEFV